MPLENKPIVEVCCVFKPRIRCVKSALGHRQWEIRIYLLGTQRVEKFTWPTFKEALKSALSWTDHQHRLIERYPDAARDSVEKYYANIRTTS